MTWLAYTILAVFFYAFYYVLSRVFLKAKNTDAISYAVLFNIICAGLLSAVALSRGFVLVDLKKYGLNVLLMGALYAAAQIFIFQASKTIEASELIILSSTRVLWTIGAALLFLGESFDLAKITGTILILFAVIFVSYKKQKIVLKRGHLFAILAGVCLGFGFVNDAYILQHADAFSYAAIVFIVPAVLTLVAFPSALGRIKKQIGVKLLRNTVLLGVFYSIGITASYAAYQNGGTASQIVPIGQSVVIVTVVLSAIFIGERDDLVKKLAAAVLVTAGVLLLR